jgi:hypothetical protein
MMNNRPHLHVKLVMSLISVVWAAAGCSITNPVPAHPVSTSELLLDEQPFPMGWQASSCDPYCEREERNGQSGRSFFRTGIPGHVIQNVFHYSSERAAHVTFEGYKSMNLSEATPSAREPFSPFQPPPEISYRSPIADEQYLGCGVDVVPGCRAGLRYGQYFVYFYFSLESGYVGTRKIQNSGLKLEEIEPILRAMDERVSLLLDIPLEIEDENP